MRTKAEIMAEVQAVEERIWVVQCTYDGRIPPEEIEPLRKKHRDLGREYEAANE